MKLVLIGERRTGKTQLLNLFRKRKFSDSYTPTEEISIDNILWDYKSGDQIKLEIWDVVDKAKNSLKKNDNLKLASSPVTTKSGSFKVEGLSLDSSVVDIWKGTHASILMIDPVKKWTFEYAISTIDKVPDNIPLLIIANFKDLQNYWIVPLVEIQEAFRERKNVYVIEASMQNGFGMKSVYNFLNIPFLKQQKKQLLDQLKQNEEDLNIAEQELLLITKKQDYNV